MPSSANSDRTGRPAPEGAGTERNDTVLLTDHGGSSGGQKQDSPTSEPPRTLPYDPESARLAVLSARYDILSEAGHGSMGNVYKARDRETGETVALKLLKPEIASDQTMMERFKNELLFARKITHKNVCRVYDFNRIDRIAYTSMEFVAGESLRSALNRFGTLAVRKAQNVALQICSGLKEAHAQGIVHRDLKPENVMIDAQGNVKIMDFGIARSMEAATRLTGSMMGTPAYMAPEQVTGKAVDYRTDIYALGLILYEMFTGAQACQADTPVAAAMKQLRETPPLPRDVDPTIPVGIERAILKCLEKEPTKRFQSIGELEKALTAPGVTGTLSGIPAVMSVPTQLRTPRAAAGPVRTTSIRPAAAAAPRRHGHPVLWTLLGAVLVIAGLAGARWIKVAKIAKLTPPPASAPARKPPKAPSKAEPIVNASVAPPSAQSAGIRTAHNAKQQATAAPVNTAETIRSTPAPLSYGAPKAPINTNVFPSVERPVKKSARQIQLERKTVPADVQQRADQAFRENSGSTTDPSADRLIWVGRYESQQRAHEVVETIRGLGVPVRAVERHPQGNDVWVVVAGPFPAKRADDVTNWLKTQGYNGAREFPLPRGTKQRGAQPK